MQRTSDGDGVFESVKIVDGVPFALQRHLDRLLGSARVLGLAAVEEQEVRDAVRRALAALDAWLARVRITLSRQGERSDIAVSLASMAPAAETVEVVTSPWPRNPRGALAGHKALVYVDDVVALAHAPGRGASEAVPATPSGELCDGTTSNVFYVVGGELRTPSLAIGCSPGVSRALVLEWFGAREIDEPIEAAVQAEEMFLVSTTRDVQPVTRWDERVVRPGPVTESVAREWRRREPELLGFDVR